MYQRGKLHEHGYAAVFSFQNAAFYELDNFIHLSKLLLSITSKRTCAAGLIRSVRGTDLDTNKFWRKQHLAQMRRSKTVY